MFNLYQQTILAAGALLGADNPDFNPALFPNMESIRIYINDKYNIEVTKGMKWDVVLEEVRNGIAKKRFNRAETVI